MTEIQHAIFSALTALQVAVYDDVPQGASFPYVIIGEDDSVPFDTDDSTGFDTELTIHIWSRYSGMKEVKDIMSDIYSILNRRELSASGAHVIDCIFQYQDVLLDPDGITRHGIIRFRLTTENI
ncbi:DUF3168 domain-containing protein [Advenella sp. WQ 585]|uniref:DUF3168 domain-containing protein n=1 Tax=Advenella mandrilli TaxID=2800330 RepID=A0ABS1EAL8_9BURK|nr:DUF3168 domain-containing protein [Advenella mandrilli]MBK1780561.1 DUF3168 domain-containing protein [Advenella mandrilli]